MGRIQSGGRTKLGGTELRVLSDETRGTSEGWKKTSEASREVTEEGPKRPEGIEGKLETEEVETEDGNRPEPGKLGDHGKGELKDIEDNRDSSESAEGEGDTLEAIDEAACNGGLGDRRSRSEV